nr:MAG: hypothetical protein [Porcellio scaber clopovirus]
MKKNNNFNNGTLRPKTKRGKIKPPFISKQTIKNVIKKSGVKRFHGPSLEILIDYYDAFTKKAMVATVKCTKNRKRKTITKEDVLNGLGRIELQTAADLTRK